MPKILPTTKVIQHSKSMRNNIKFCIYIYLFIYVVTKKTRRNGLKQKKMLSISTTLSGVISRARSFLLAGCGTLGRWVPQNPG